MYGKGGIVLLHNFLSRWRPCLKVDVYCCGKRVFRPNHLHRSMAKLNDVTLAGSGSLIWLVG